MLLGKRFEFWEPLVPSAAWKHGKSLLRNVLIVKSCEGYSKFEKNNESKVCERVAVLRDQLRKNDAFFIEEYIAVLESDVLHLPPKADVRYGFGTSGRIAYIREAAEFHSLLQMIERYAVCGTINFLNFLRRHTEAYFPRSNIRDDFERFVFIHFLSP